MNHELQLPINAHQFIAVDIETTGLNPFDDSIIEIGTYNGVRNKYSVLINPGHPIPEKITAINGITDSMVKYSKQIKDVLPFILDSFEGKILISHNAEFDFKFITFNAVNNNLQIPNCPVLCTLNMSKKLFPDMKHKLSDMKNMFGIKTESEHTALDDATSAMLIFLGLTEYMKSAMSRVPSLHEVYNLACGRSLLSYAPSKIIN